MSTREKTLIAVVGVMLAVVAGCCGDQRMLPGKAAAPAGGGPATAPAATGPATSPVAAAPAAPVVDEATRHTIRKELLENWDRDHNGKLSRPELMRMSVHLFVTRKYLKLFDKNANGRIDKDEYPAVTEFIQTFRDPE